MHENRPKGNLQICCGANKRTQRFYTESTGENSISSSIIGFYDLKQRAVDRAGRASHNERSLNAAPVRAVSLFHAINYKMDPKWLHKVRTRHSAVRHSAAQTHAQVYPSTPQPVPYTLYTNYANYCNRFTANLVPCSLVPDTPLLPRGPLPLPPPSLRPTITPIIGRVFCSLLLSTYYANEKAMFHRNYMLC